MPYSKAQWITDITIGTAPNELKLGRFKSWEGGGIDSGDGKYQNWDGEIVLGGRKTRENGTAKRLYREADFGITKDLEARVNQPAKITRTPTGDDDLPWGDPIVLSGKLKAVKIPDHDAGSDDDGGELELEFSLNTSIA